ncbi:hypothetical protein COW36_15080 [bacterium (Candidatus Blackallbacteria) CG17_big_fil_post_rev_8_21_14_2_50_48_46]|uniref:Uncharacterized protein n=1 Tax=bacterium (Candidatus Blackallbacteria) CG17_big_fil_post_rev_8_21_14_2_50_48_46 TaxID=2014261 RepID=A0A2M7G2L8_9BACT|nr:MAG: hypothetical protein COW64_11470 [bacterium (Candidatus Blackallbacteria) CG18_big_fil_WC_8_21_14_2_50_49_26]PIW16033.1 MAG: hypothetical protein COW36_15080 [bacterium (Candidatus Blackallbacteria) CG17_big_fil_post_rev_8_21_14_2_50_48_46]PIW50445.1 MAG: hypothetical protein COW20_02795 [bacterium (Candidatus Blackallbacteria) CG13_big_fil_rev_8_21_14_2_50_49_14]
MNGLINKVALLLLSLQVSACTSAGPPASTASSQPVAQASTSLTNQNPALENTVTSTEIRPNSKGQKLEFGEVEGDLIIPAGTSSFLVQSQFALLNLDFILGAPAYAQTSDEISEEQIRQFKARVDGEDVKLTIQKISRNAEGDRVINYLLPEVPALDYTQVLEFYSPSNTLSFKGLVPQVRQNIRTRLNDPVDLDSTAVLEIVSRDQDFYVHQMSANDIKELKENQEIKDFRRYLKEELTNKANRLRKFEDIANKYDINTRVLPKVKPILDAAISKDLQICRTNPQECLSRLQQCRPTPLKRCPQPEQLLRQARSQALRPGILIPR